MPKPKTQKNVKQKLDKALKVDDIDQLVKETLVPFDSASMKQFSDLPLSVVTKQGLQDAGFIDMTDIQRCSLGFSLCGRDVLGAAKTGSGKSLAFLIPVIESLYKQKWSTMDGLGALIISPTRELALQTFMVLRKIGKHHQLSAGLAIGGKDFDEERDRISRMNILVTTPGRLLQHMDETVNFECQNLQMLVLDEADRLLDLGFKKAVNSIIEFIPIIRQTLLFSATQTKSVRDLARLSLKSPEYVACHEKSQNATPDALNQNYLVCELYEKLDILYSFVRSHLKSKVIVFMSSCKQVRLVNDIFCKLQPGTVLMCLHGKQKQIKRNIMFEKFSKSTAAVLFCTDIAARGLDFPAVDWVIQVDCPEDVDSYLHRVGRTARYNANGNALMMLLPSEEPAMKINMQKKKIPINQISVNPSKTVSIIPQLQSICAENPEIKYLAEKTFICYLRSVWLQKDKNVFDVTKLPLEEYAQSLGLQGAPQVKFVNKLKAQKNMSYAEQNNAPSTIAENDSKQVKTRMDRVFSKKHDTSRLDKITVQDEEDLTLAGNNEDLLVVARKDHDIENVPEMAEGFMDHDLSIRDKRKQKLKHRTKAEANEVGSQGVKLIFDDDGVPELAWKLEKEADFVASGGILEKHTKYIDAAKSIMTEADLTDKQLAKQKRREEKEKLKRKRKIITAEETLVCLGSASEVDESVDNQHVQQKRQKQEADEELALRLLSGDN